MCENDATVDAWFAALNKRAVNVSRFDAPNIQPGMEMAAKSGYMRGVIRELAVSVPGVREWLVEHMPGER